MLEDDKGTRCLVARRLCLLVAGVMIYATGLVLHICAVSLILIASFHRALSGTVWSNNGFADVCIHAHQDEHLVAHEVWARVVPVN